MVGSASRKTPDNNVGRETVTLFNRRSILAAAAAATLVAGAAAPKAQAQDIPVGLLLSATGGLAPFTPAIRAAAVLAVNQVNEAGGVLNGRKLRLVEADDQTNPQAGVAAANRLVQVDNVVALLGPLGSGVTIPVAQTATIPNGVMLVTPSATAPAISQLTDNDLVFRTVVPDDLQGRVSARVAREQGLSRVAVMAVNNDYGRGLQAAFVQAFQQAGGTITSQSTWEENRASYRSEIAAAAGQGQPEALFLVGYPASGGTTILRQSLENGFFNRFVLTDGMRDPSVVQAVGGQNLARSFGTAGGSAAAPERMENYAAAYRRVTPNADPSGSFAPQMYDAAMTIALAIQKAGSTDRAAIAKAMREVANGPGEVVGPGEFAKAKEHLAGGRKINYEGASGPIDFDPAGDAAGAIDVWVVKDNQITVQNTFAR
ncbi:MAG TPA: ABC transporter substrate-binding protein [Azospirillaceae bacterium]|nr:ABC transporter substrate-binding protein [Azospirillaceae bacterium]